MITILNVVGALAGLSAALLGLTPAEKFIHGWPTKKGWWLIFFALVTAGTQVRVQLIQASEKKAAEQRAATIKSVVTKAYSGWVKVGTYANDRWEKLSLSLDTPSKALKKGTLLSAGTQYAYFINIHSDKPDHCNAPKQWFESTAVNVLGRGTLVEILDVVELACAPGKAEIWAHVQPFV